MTIQELIVMDEQEIELAAEIEFSDLMTRWEDENWTDSLQPKTFPMPPCPERLTPKEWYQRQLASLATEAVQ